MVANRVPHQARQLRDVAHDQLAPELFEQPLPRQRTHFARDAFAMRTYAIGELDMSWRRPDTRLIGLDAGLHAEAQQLTMQPARYIQRAKFENPLRKNPHLPGQVGGKPERRLR